MHACVGYVELGTDSWITNITDSILIGQGFFLFVYTSSIMFILRFFAGPIVERINPLGLLCISTILGTLGLLMLGSVQAISYQAKSLDEEAFVIGVESDRHAQLVQFLLERENLEIETLESELSGLRPLLYFLHFY